jgi:hypothetical protein
VGSRARLRNGPAHRPRASSNSEPNRCSSSAFSPSFLAFSHYPIPLHSSFLLPSSFIPSARPSTPPAAVKRHSLFLSSHRRRLVHARLRRPATQPPPPSFSHHILLPARHAVFPFRFRFRLCLCPRPRPAARFRAAAPPMLLTPRRCLSPAARAHDIRAPQPPLRHRQWTLDLTCFVVTSARPSRFVLISTFPSSLRYFSSISTSHYTPSYPSRSRVPAVSHSLRPLALVFSSTLIPTAARHVVGSPLLR